MTETIENKKFSEKNGNFQTMNMIYKIKNIKKKRKQPENMKKMPFPEVLKNTMETDPLPISESESLKKPIIEGFDRFNFVHDDWDGYDNVNDNTADVNSKDPRQILIDFINYVYNSTIAYNKKLASYLTDKISNNKAAKEVNTEIKTEIKELKSNFGIESEIAADTQGNQVTDADKFYNYICIIEALTFSCFVVNNWYFLLYFNNFDKENNFLEEKRVKLTDFSVDMIKGLPDNSLMNRIIKNGLLYFFEYALFFPVTFQWFLLQVVPKTTIRWFNHMILYIILFLFIFFCSYYLAGSFKDFLIDCINANMKNVLVSIMLATVVILFLVPDPDSEASVFNHNYDARREAREIKRTNEKIEQQTALRDELIRKINQINPKDRKDELTDNEKRELIKLRNELQKVTEGKGNWFSSGLNQTTDKYKESIEKTKDKYNTKPTQEGVVQNDNIQTGGYYELDGGGFTEDISDRASKFGNAASGIAGQGFANMKQQGMSAMLNAAPKSKADAAASVLKILWNCVRFLVVITISVPFGALFCVGYFIFYSLYAMLYYYDRDFTKIMSAFIEMLEFIDNKKPEDAPKPTDSTFQLFVKKLYEYMEYISDNFFIIVYLITFFILLGDSQKNITNNTLRNALYFIDLSFIFMILAYLYYIIKSRFNISSMDDLISLANGSREPQPKNYDGSASGFNTANYGVYGLTMAGVIYMLYSVIEFNLPKSMQFA